MAFSDKVTEEVSEEGLKLGHRLIDGVTKDIESMQFNTAIAKLMEFMNEFTKLSAYPKEVVRMAAQALAPLAPHLAEEVWQHIGSIGSIINAPFPIAEERYLRDENVTLVVQVNGKLRGRLDLPVNHPEEAVLEAAKANSHVVAHLEGKEIVKVVFVPNKLLNIVVKP
jgi:leucyl-tRNA synthetase